MSSFDYPASGFAVRDEIVSLHRASWESIARAGSFWTGAQRVEIARQARAARTLRGEAPRLRKGLPDAAGRLPEQATQAARSIGADAHKIDADWAKGMIDSLGDSAYVELGAVVATVSAIDAFCEALGLDHEPLPQPVAGEPDGERLAEAAEAGAYVPMLEPWRGPNVGRALSLVPAANTLFFQNVMAMYKSAGCTFFDLEWIGPITRPQAELLAARVSALNECFY